MRERLHGGLLFEEDHNWQLLEPSEELFHVPEASFGQSVCWILKTSVGRRTERGEKEVQQECWKRETTEEQGVTSEGSHLAPGAGNKWSRDIVPQQRLERSCPALQRTLRLELPDPVILTRAAPLLHLTWDEVEVIKSEGKLDTDRHKTGRYYDVTIELQQDQLKWLRRKRRMYVKESKQEPSLMFASSVNRVEQSMSKNIRSVLAHLFEDKVGNKDFHATAGRKMWDAHFHNNRQQFKDSVFNSHLQQTGQ